MQLTAPSELFNFSILDSTWLSSLLHPCLPTENRNEAYAVRQSMFGNRKLLVVHGSTSRRKSWSVDRLQAVLSIFLDEHPEFAVCLIGQTRLPFTTDRSGRPFEQLCDLRLGTALALVGQADLFLGVDSCMLHAADLFRVPSVGLFGSTMAVEWGIRFASGVNIQAPGAMSAISVTLVLEAVKSAMSSQLPAETWVIESQDNEREH